jgi:hypothetical protein
MLGVALRTRHLAAAQGEARRERRVGRKRMAGDREEGAWLQTPVVEGIVGWVRFLCVLVKLGYRETRTGRKLGENRERF